MSYDTNDDFQKKSSGNSARVPIARPRRVGAGLPTGSSAGSAQCCCGKPLNHPKLCDTKYMTRILDSFFKECIDRTPKPHCGCTLEDPCDTHAYIETVQYEVFSCLAELESATDKQIDARGHLSMLRSLFAKVAEPSKADLDQFLTYLQSVSRITSTERNVTLGNETASNSAGGGKVSYDQSKKAFGGRPAFDAKLVEKMAVNTGQHRRHIIPWHHIRGFVNACLRANIPVSVVEEALDTSSQDSEHMKGMRRRAHEKTEKTVEKGPAQTWAVALALMNSCSANLWVGPGRQNVAINSNFFAISNALESWKDDHALMVKQLQELKVSSNSHTGVKHNKEILLQRAEFYLSERHHRPVSVVKRPALGTLSNNVQNVQPTQLTIETLGTIGTSKDDPFLAGLHADVEEYAMKWALTSLCYDVPVGKVDPKVCNAIASLHGVVLGGKAATEDAAKVVFAALLQPPKW